MLALAGFDAIPLRTDKRAGVDQVHFRPEADIQWTLANLFAPNMRPRPD